MNSKDEMFQDEIERGNHSNQELNEDKKVYQQIFRALANDMDRTLPENFADSVVKAIAKKNQRSYRFDLLWSIAGLLVIMAGFIFIVIKTQFKLNLGFLTNIIHTYKGLILFAVVFILFLHVVDKRFIKNKRAI